MKKYCLPEMPATYWLHLLKYECKKCRKTFQNHTPYSGDGVVDFESQTTHKIKWLPEYGNGGYLDLFNKLNPNFNGKLIPKVINTFMEELNKFIEKDGSDYFALRIHKHQCPHCQSKDLIEIEEEVLIKPDLDWLKISCDLIER
jgi:DNA-directed RNA polymerase subunit RPC12/RpoP